MTRQTIAGIATCMLHGVLVVFAIGATDSTQKSIPLLRASLASKGSAPLSQPQKDSAKKTPPQKTPPAKDPRQKTDQKQAEPVKEKTPTTPQTKPLANPSPQKSSSKPTVDKTPPVTGKTPVTKATKPDTFDPEAEFAKAAADISSQAATDSPKYKDSTEPSYSPGPLDGNRHGWAMESRGHPWEQQLAKELRQAWQLPTLVKATGRVVGCLQFAAVGTIDETDITEKSAVTAIDRSVEVALRSVRDSRNKKPIAVPKQLFSAMRRFGGWICHEFPV